MDRSALPPGTRLGEMEILRVVAIGGFGIVYLARDHSLDRDVAVKEFMPSQLVGRSQGQRVTVRSTSKAETFALGLQSFVNEAKLLAKFSHPAMVKVYRFWEANGTAYMAMPYLRGPTLTDVRCSMSEPPTEVWLRSVIDPLLDALAMLHSEGFYHRDIAPDNVLVSGAGMPVLLDFGASRRLTGDRTQSPTAVLKPHYAPIEQYAESTQLRQGPWTDLYALAALVTYLLDGKPPPASTARSIHDEREVLAERRIPGVSRTFLSAIDWALEVRPQDRPQNVAELRDALNGRPVVPSPGRLRQPAEPGEAGAALAARSAVPFPATIRWSRPATPGRRFALRLPVATAGVLVAAAMAWPLALHAPAGTAPEHLELAEKPASARPFEAPGAVASGDAVDSLFTPASRAGAASADMGAAEAFAKPPAQWPPIQQSLASGSKLREPGVKAQMSSARKAAQGHKLAGARTVPAGPHELCAGRNFFLRPFCIHSRCEEPRFRARPECVQVRQAQAVRRD
ncbi:serine/threonine protein kinase [Methylibium sp.]|uniref:serine/threonine protein kinase n=1 Tax=Methylibium sp. TaxID=2067992 RepID=UPI003D0F46BD